MSTETPAKEKEIGEDGGKIAVPNVQELHEVDIDETPKSEAPPSFNVMTPGTTEAVAKQMQGVDEVSNDYFTPQVVAANEVRAQTLKPYLPAGGAYAGHALSPNDLDPLQSLPRPIPQQSISALSVESAESAATIRATARPTVVTRPTFPNQAFAALHSQQYPPPYLPPNQRYSGVGLHSGVHTFTSAIASLHHRPGVQTSHNSPAVTPGAYGLFSPQGPPSAPALDTESSGTYASPFLHFTHTHVPKETHVADVDVDPISGRKLINHYEVIDELGRGTHGKVKLGRDLHTQETYVAIKIVERFSKRRKLGRLGTTEDKVKKEVAILKKARHPNVVALLEVIDDPTRKKVYIVLEWVARGEINWRVKGQPEICRVEARRYEREKSGNQDEYLAAEDRAVLDEAKKRLDKQKRRALKQFRMSRKEHADHPGLWSIEMGDSMSEESEDDRLSRISSMTDANTAASPPQNWLGADQETLSPVQSDAVPSTQPISALTPTGLEGTMYGAYEPDSDPTSAIPSLPNSLRGSAYSSFLGLTERAVEILNTDLDSELEYVPVMTMDQIRVAFRDTLLGLQYLHYQGIVHRDIKPPNLLATLENRVKISDFGVSYLGRPIREGEGGEDVSEGEAHDLDDEAKELAKTVGTPAFYAPELCTIDPNDEPLPVTKAIDVWALGITLFCMLFARTPFVDDQYVVMRQIADEEVFIPRQRLQPIDSKPKSRPGSHGRAFPPLPFGRRHEMDFKYEELGDDLYDLLKRLLIKDPRQRINLEDVRHHPWVTEDIANREEWLSETDPTRQAQKKIEISTEELNTAVVPLTMVDKVKNVIDTGLKKLGLNSISTSGRKRTSTNASQSKDRSPAASANSSSSTISQDGRRTSLRGEELLTVLRGTHEHSPLANSLTVSPETGKRERSVPRLNGTSDSSNRMTKTRTRPSPPHRAMTVASTAESMRTVTQSDFAQKEGETPPPSPGLPGTPTALATPGGSGLGGLLGGAGRYIKSVRNSSRQRPVRRHDARSETGSVGSSDPHTSASIAISQATASGHVQQESHRDYTSRSSAQNSRQNSRENSRHNSPNVSRATSVTSEERHQHLNPADRDIPSRMGSTSSMASSGRRAMLREGGRPTSRNINTNESSAEDWQRADDERIRKLRREYESRSERMSASPHLSGSPRSFDGRDCPESPDDHPAERQHSSALSVSDLSDLDAAFDSMSPTGQNQLFPSNLVSSSSDLGSAVSMSISNPSIPSAISAASSLDPNTHDEAGYPMKRDPSSDDTANHTPRDQLSIEDQEAAIANSECDEEDDEFDSSSDSDGGLVMSRRRSKQSNGHGASAPLGVDRKERRGTGMSSRSKKSSRSGSNNTMKKVRTRENEELGKCEE